MPTSPSLLTDHELAGAALAHPFALLLTRPAIRALADIASGTTPLTQAERRLLHRALAAIDLAEVEISRRAAP